MDKKSLYLTQIGQHAPELDITSAVFNQDGQYNDVLIVNDALVFRFAKAAPAIETLQRELMILRHLQDHLPLPIPTPLYCNVKSVTVGEAFIGYPMIAGKPLWRDTFLAIDDSLTLDRLAEQLAHFLQTLHQLDADAMFPEKLPRDETHAYWLDLYQRIEAKLFEHMRPDARRQIAAHFDAYLNAPIPFTPTLRHGDFGTGNILYQAETGNINGIIDFAFTQIGDPATDFAGIYASYGEAFYKRCCATYPMMASAFDRVHFYYGTFALQEALYGIEHNNVEAFEAGIMEFR